LGVLAFAGRAYAQGPRFGAANQVVLSTDATTSVSYFSSFGTDARAFGLSLSPSLDFFFARNVSIGAGLDVFYDSSRSGGVDATSVGGGVRGRLGVNVPLGRWVSWWPQAQAAFIAAHDQAGSSGEAISSPTIGLYAPLLLQLRTHFFIGFGPFVSHTFDGVQVQGKTPFADDQTRVSLETVISGTLGGDADPDDDAAPVRWKPFGERGEVVLRGSASIGWNGDQTLGFWSAGVSASAGIDVFVARQFSIGVAASGAYTRAQTNAPSETWNASVRPEIGWNAPIAERFSFYPTMSLGLGVSSAGSSTKFDLDVGAYLPVLYHFAPHVFAGFGPTVDVVLLDAQNPSVQLDGRSASVGAALSVGGWL